MSNRRSQLILAVITLTGLAGTTSAIVAEPPTLPLNKAATQAARVQTTADAKPEITNRIGMPLRFIRAGNFLMGSRDDEPESTSGEHPQHRVRITKPFYLGKYEVTRGEYRKFIAATNYQTDEEKQGAIATAFSEKKKSFVEGEQFNWLNVGFEQTDDHPVVNVSWNNAVEFCRWLSKHEGKRYRLPTEAEWEWACRGGTIERWSCGEDEANLQAHANIGDASLLKKFPAAIRSMNWNDGVPFTSAVGKFKPNGFGLHDMHGNVGEWCSDWLNNSYYPDSPKNDPQGPTSGVGRVNRGGSWAHRQAFCRSAWRHGNFPSWRSVTLGFRVALTP